LRTCGTDPTTECSL